MAAVWMILVALMVDPDAAASRGVLQRVAEGLIYGGPYGAAWRLSPLARS